MKSSAKNNFVVLSSVGLMRDVAWLAKMETLLLESEHSFEYWCWERDARPDSEVPKYIRRIIFCGGGRATKRLLLYYPIWMLVVFIRVLFAEKEKRFLAINFDTAFPAAMASMFRRTPYIFANRDNIWMSHGFPAPIKWMLRKCENFAVWRSTLHIIPGVSRWGRVGRKERILPSCPSSVHLLKAKALADAKNYYRNDKFTIYVNGWLVRTRGLDSILGAVQKIQSENVEVVLAGKDYSEEAKELAKLNCVTDFGKISAEESLALYFKSHLVVCMYDPSIEINRVAEPNKWQDCIATGTPFVTNDEVLTAKPYFEMNACFHVPYHDVDALANLLHRLIRHRAEWAAVQENLIRHFSTEPWDILMAKILDEFLDKEKICAASASKYP